MPDVNCRNCTPLARATTSALVALRRLLAQPGFAATTRHGDTHGQ